MKVVTADQMQGLDRRTVFEFGVTGGDLMERAGCGVAESVMRLAECGRLASPRVHVITGHGNNGGDGYVIARVLNQAGWDVDVWLAGSTDSVGGDALTQLERMMQDGISVREMSTEHDWSLAEADPSEADIVIDAVLGTGVEGPVRGAVCGAIRYINAVSVRSLIVAVDIPSGLNADTGVPEGVAVVADLTVVMAQPKWGHVLPAGIAYVGSVEVVDIGIPRAYVSELVSDGDMVSDVDVRLILERRDRATHKGVYGHALIIGGAAGYTGAVSLATEACGRSGAGLVSVITPERLVPIVAPMVREAMVHGGVETESGSLGAESLDVWMDRLKDFECVLIGPGMTTHADTRASVDRVLAEATGAVVLDADALNVMAGEAASIQECAAQVVLTPHPGELARLLGCSVAEVQSDRRGKALELARLSGACVVLKGAGTIVITPEGDWSVNVTGNPGMATGGMGDVLAGLVCGFLTQGVSTWMAARAAVYLHGRAADVAAWGYSQRALLAGDVLDELPEVMRECGLR